MTAIVNPKLLPAPAQGWECPRCRAINAPSVQQCTCSSGMRWFESLPQLPPAVLPILEAAERCAFESMEQNTPVGLVCTCPRCSPRCSI